MFASLKNSIAIEIFVSFLAGIAFTLLALSTSPVLAIAGVISLCIAVLIFFYPNLGLLMTIALVPLERFGRFTDDTSEFTISLMRIAGILVLGMFLHRRLLEKKPIILDKTFFIYLCYCITVTLSLFYTTDASGTKRAVSSVLANLLFFFLVINLVRTRKLILQALVVWLVVSTIIGTYSIYDWYLGSGRGVAPIAGEVDPGKGVQSTSTRWSTIWHDAAELESLSGKSLKRTMGSTSHSAVYGINLVLTLPFLLLFLNFTKNNIVKIAIWSAIAVITYNILLTNTRATILLAGIVGLMSWYKGLIRLRTSTLILGAIVSALLALIVIPEDVFNRVLDIANYTQSKSASLRIRQEYFFAGLRAFADSWLIGHGAANENIIPSFISSWSTAPSKTTVHNEYLQTLIELGLIGALFLFSFVGMLLLYCHRIEKRFTHNPSMQQEAMLASAIKVSMIATLIYGLQVDVFHFPLKGWWMLAGMTVFLNRLSLRSSQAMVENSTPTTASFR